MRQVIQLLAIPESATIAALCTDGTIWKMYSKTGLWQPFPPIPDSDLENNPVQIGKTEEVYQRFYLDGNTYYILDWRTPREGEFYLTADGTAVTIRGKSPADGGEKRLILIPL